MDKFSNGISRRTMFRATGALAATTVLATGGQSRAQDAIAGRDVMKDKRPVIHPGGSKFGAYDPHGDFRDEEGLATEHLFLPWEDVELSGLGAADDYAFERGRKVLITVEPWSWDLDWNVSSTELRQRILAGYYDDNMRAICNAVAGFKSPVIIRWAHEMDNPYGRFTWSIWPPADYITAFGRMHAIIKEILPEAKVMWSPRGEKSLPDYYPGDENVDIVGLSVFGLQGYDEIEYGKPRSFAEALKQGYELSEGFGKPIWVAELAYEGGREYLTKWVEEATMSYPEFPALEEVVYFNDREVWPWPHGLGLPQWRVIRDVPTLPQRPNRR
jgi:endoglucanase